MIGKERKNFFNWKLSSANNHFRFLVKQNFKTWNKHSSLRAVDIKEGFDKDLSVEVQRLEVKDQGKCWAILT